MSRRTGAQVLRAQGKGGRILKTWRSINQGSRRRIMAGGGKPFRTVLTVRHARRRQGLDPTTGRKR